MIEREHVFDLQDTVRSNRIGTCHYYTFISTFGRIRKEDISQHHSQFARNLTPPPLCHGR
jgi:hypothetical protein